MYKANAQVESSLIDGGIPKLAAKVMAARGVKSLSEALELLDTSSKLIIDPSSMADISKGVYRIKQAIERGEHICIYGDYDVDGITASALFVRWLMSKKAKVTYYIPDRSDDGYGLNTDTIDKLKSRGVSLIVTVDLGITAVAEVAYANSIGLDIVITDHHDYRNELPNAYAVINPYRTDCGYPFKFLSGVGVVFMVIIHAEGYENLEELLTKYSELVAVGTISDVMPIVGVNRALVWRGLEEINRSPSVGLRALIKEIGPGDVPVNTGVVGFSLAPRINAAGRIGCARDAAELFLTSDSVRAQELALHLCELNRTRQKTENDTYEEVLSQVEEYLQTQKEKPGALVLANDKWHQGVIGIIASRLSERFACPAVLIHVENGMGKGSARSFYGINILTIMQKLSHLFDTWGGHEFAVGFTIKENNIPELRTQLKKMTRELENAHIHVDAELTTELLTPELIKGLIVLEPHGAMNPGPIFAIENVNIKEIVSMGWGKSLKLTVEKDGLTYPAFFFGMNMERLDMCEGDTTTAICKVEVHENRGTESVRFVLFDLRQDPKDYALYKKEMDLFQRFISGAEVTHKEALMLIPRKVEFIALLRYIKRNTLTTKRITVRVGSMCRQICREEKLDPTYAKLLVCLKVLAEKNRLSYTVDDDILVIEMLEEGPTNLNTSPVMIRLISLINRAENREF